MGVRCSSHSPVMMSSTSNSQPQKEHVILVRIPRANVIAAIQTVHVTAHFSYAPAPDLLTFVRAPRGLRAQPLNAPPAQSRGVNPVHAPMRPHRAAGSQPAKGKLVDGGIQVDSCKMVGGLFAACAGLILNEPDVAGQLKAYDLNPHAISPGPRECGRFAFCCCRLWVE